ncbi:hypothetical protein CHLRE_13g590950v5 [Chlamydomonas reinhardtii]|uniref:Uncharacterized protein n=1 Tax=Chlamydomonas reinhardtii TaxID=3055 RepID=A0A2K3D145_CHLRE|nr:uncharacterized protein CHLRE_13g590950v5 [Chlamydomonas reinhardtii]PNW74244.1 hypothetical protein CHLRE_13g590950v5 [Chlamydomonas reinhardtii]
MEHSITLLDVLRVLPTEGREAIFGSTFSPDFAGARLACQDLKRFHDDSITHFGVVVEQIHLHSILRTPLLSNFSRCTKVSLYLDGNAGGGHLVSLVLAGVSAAIRQRITQLHVGKAPAQGTKFIRDDSHDALHIVQACAPMLPSLEELVLDFHDHGPPRAHEHLLFQLLATFLPNLRRLVVPAMWDRGMSGVGALAACPQLSSLIITSPKALRLTWDMLEGLSRLPRLRHLLLACSGLTGRTDDLTHALFSTHRPPAAHTITISPVPNKPTLQLKYGPLQPPLQPLPQPHPQPHLAAAGTSTSASTSTAAAASAAQPAGAAWGICHVLVGTRRGSGAYNGHDSDLPGLSQVAALVLGAADRLRQAAIPHLAIQVASGPGDRHQPDWHQQPGLLAAGAAGAPLPRLVARCARVELGWLLVRPWQEPAAPAAVVRLLGMPRQLSLCHGRWRCRMEEDTPAAAEEGRPAGREQQQQEWGQERVQGEGQGEGQEGQQQARGQQGPQAPQPQRRVLSLAALTPLQLLQEVVDRLRTHAERHKQQQQQQEQQEQEQEEQQEQEQQQQQQQEQQQEQEEQEQQQEGQEGQEGQQQQEGQEGQEDASAAPGLGDLAGGAAACGSSSGSSGNGSAGASVDGDSDDAAVGDDGGSRYVLAFGTLPRAPRNPHDPLCCEKWLRRALDRWFAPPRADRAGDLQQQAAGREQERQHQEEGQQPSLSVGEEESADARASGAASAVRRGAVGVAAGSSAGAAPAAAAAPAAPAADAAAAALPRPQQLWALIDEASQAVAAPAVGGMVLLECRSSSAARAMAAGLTRLAEAAEASGRSPRVSYAAVLPAAALPSGCEEDREWQDNGCLFRKLVFQALMDVWEQAVPPPSRAAAAAPDRAAGGAATSNGAAGRQPPPPVAAAAPAGAGGAAAPAGAGGAAARPPAAAAAAGGAAGTAAAVPLSHEEMLVRLERLLGLDVDVRQLWLQADCCEVVPVEGEEEAEEVEGEELDADVEGEELDEDEDAGVGEVADGDLLGDASEEDGSSEEEGFEEEEFEEEGFEEEA